MKFAPRKAHLLLLALMPILQGCGLFAGGPPIVLTNVAGSCSKLIPNDWWEKDQPIGAPLPADASSVGDWIVFGDRQTERLGTVYGQGKSTVGIIKACEARDAEVARALRPRSLFERLTPWRE